MSNQMLIHFNKIITYLKYFTTIVVIIKNYRRMSITISNCTQICASPTNNSKAKMLYTFSKGERFSKRRIILCDKFYDTKENSPARTTSLGFGHKYDFTKDGPRSPPPNTYNLKSDFDQDKRKGFGFGCGRNQLQVTGPFMQTLKNKNPGPGSYELKNTLQQGSFAMRGKNYHEDSDKKKVPGPGSYPITFSINEKGLYFLSKFKNSCTKSFKYGLSRQKIMENKMPGPGAYDLAKTDLSPQGKYCLSKMPSVLSRKFGTSQRSFLQRKIQTPGPGNYRLPSEFGYYCSKNAMKKPATQQHSRKALKQTKSSEENKQNVKE